MFNQSANAHALKLRSLSGFPDATFQQLKHFEYEVLNVLVDALRDLGGNFHGSSYSKFDCWCVSVPPRVGNGQLQLN